MKERLYYDDAYLVEFAATVTSIENANGRRIVHLDRTAFYPTSGGQPNDVGLLDDVRVVDVYESEAGDVLHQIDGELPAGAHVRGRVDWTRRFDHMQQHTGQHVLSAAFEAVAGARTESFHLGAESSTIDLSRDLSGEQVASAEEHANRVVWEDRPVTIRYVDATEAVNLPLRKPPAREGTLRLIDVENFDLSACGGTHVRRTGAIGIIAIAGWERFRGGTRVEFVCGGRALERHRRLRDVSASMGRLLSVHMDELPAAIERIQGEAKDARRRLKDAQLELAGVRADELARKAPDGILVEILEGWDQAGLKAVASSLAARPGFVVGLLGVPVPASLVIARSADRTADCASIMKQVTTKFGGKGGGRPELAQGGGLSGDAQEIAGSLRALLRGSAAL